MVEGTVLLHEDDDVLDVLDRSRAALCRDGGGPRDALVQHREGGGASGYLQEPATVELCHGWRPLGWWGDQGRPKDSGPGVPEGGGFVTPRRTPGERKLSPRPVPAHAGGWWEGTRNASAATGSGPRRFARGHVPATGGPVPRGGPVGFRPWPHRWRCVLRGGIDGPGAVWRFGSLQLS